MGLFILPLSWGSRASGRTDPWRGCWDGSPCKHSAVSLGCWTFLLASLAPIFAPAMQTKPPGTTMVASPAKAALSSRARGQEMLPLKRGFPSPQIPCKEVPAQGRCRAGMSVPAGKRSGDDPEQPPPLAPFHWGGNRGQQRGTPPSHSHFPSYVQPRGCEGHRRIQAERGVGDTGVGMQCSCQHLLPSTYHRPHLISGAQVFVVSIAKTSSFSKMCFP